MTKRIVNPMTYLPGTGWVDRPEELVPPLEGEATCDVAVVGGGVGGMAAALRLAELGIDVALVESDVCGWGASGRNAGYLSNTVGSDPWILKKFYGDRVRGLIGFANTSVTFTEDLMSRHAIECHYDPSGFFVSAVTRAQLAKLKKMTRPGGRTQVVDHREAGLPSTFLGGIHVQVGGVLNPGELSLGLRDVVIAAGVRVFEQSPVRRVDDSGAAVTVHTDRGSIRANQVILTNNAFMNELDIAPRRLSTPVRVTAVETEPVSPEQLDAAGWTSRIPMTTPHWVMESYRTTERGTIVFTTRKLQMHRGARGDFQPDQKIVAELLAGFRDRFPGLRDVQPMRAWGGWIGMTPSNLPVAGLASPRVHYSMACNGHGLPQAPYLGHLLAEYVAGEPMHDDLRTAWRTRERFAPGVVNPVSLKLGWLADRLTDRVDRVGTR